MPEPKFTKGPWSVYDQDDFQKKILVCTLRPASNYDSPVADRICWTEQNPFIRGSDSFRARKIVDLANAQLIAAAPDLLEACRRAEQFIRNGIELGVIHMPDAGTPDPAHETPDIITAAISKAEGRS